MSFQMVAMEPGVLGASDIALLGLEIDSPTDLAFGPCPQPPPDPTQPGAGGDSSNTVAIAVSISVGSALLIVLALALALCLCCLATRRRRKYFDSGLDADPESGVEMTEVKFTFRYPKFGECGECSQLQSPHPQKNRCPVGIDHPLTVEGDFETWVLRGYFQTQQCWLWGARQHTAKGTEHAQREDGSLPPIILNPIENIRGIIKHYIATHREWFVMSEVERLTREGIAHVTPEMWKKSILHAEKIEEEMWYDDEAEYIVEEFDMSSSSSSYIILPCPAWLVSCRSSRVHHKKTKKMSR